MQNKINHVAIVGGTHGNELTGVYLVTSYLENPSFIERTSFDTMALYGNPKAMAQCRRYVDTDLNRCFALKDLNDHTLTSYEAERAKELNQLLGPKNSESPHVDFVMDLHTTTSNMGLSLCISTKDPFTWQAAAYAKDQLPELNLFYWESKGKEPSFISSIPSSGFSVEVGPIAQGILRPDIYMQTDRIVQAVLDFCHRYNTEDVRHYGEVEIYDYASFIDYPRDEKGNLTAMIHPDLKNSGYNKLNYGDPLFQRLDGGTIYYENKESYYSVFVNEAAYYEKGVALQLCRKKIVNL